MSNPADWLFNSVGAADGVGSDGLVAVKGYSKDGKSPEEVAVMEKAELYRADAVFFEAGRDGKPPVPQAFIYRSDWSANDSEFAKLHQQLWSWGGVPLVYRVTRGLVQLFRCAHRPDFEKGGEIVCRPFKTLKVAVQVANDPWWDADRLRNGTLWDDPEVRKKLLSSKLAAQKTLIHAVKELNDDLNRESILPKALSSLLKNRSCA